MIGSLFLHSLWQTKLLRTKQGKEAESPLSRTQIGPMDSGPIDAARSQVPGFLLAQFQIPTPHLPSPQVLPLKTSSHEQEGDRPLCPSSSSLALTFVTFMELCLPWGHPLSTAQGSSMPTSQSQGVRETSPWLPQMIAPFL